jgi:poly(3-hydroxybutyrate) depolymerase
MYTDNEDNHANCTPAVKPTPILEFHGSADATIFYDGELDGNGGETPPIPEWLEYWGQRNGCGPNEGEVTLSHDNSLNHTTYSCNQTENIVEGYWIKGMSHSWPSTQSNSDNKEHGDGPTFIDATPIIIDFFDRTFKPDSLMLNVQ